MPPGPMPRCAQARPVVGVMGGYFPQVAMEAYYELGAQAPPLPAPAPPRTLLIGPGVTPPHAFAALLSPRGSWRVTAITC